MDAPARAPLSHRPAGGVGAAPARILQRECDCGRTPGMHGECDQCRERHLQRSAVGSGSTSPTIAPPIVHQVIGGGGEPLAPGVRHEMESRLGHDLSRVRVHTGPRADASTRAVRAHAYTVGPDVVFAGGRYRPETTIGRRLLAHELAHTVQQSGAARSGPIAVSPASHPLERNADAAAAGRERARPAPSALLQRQGPESLPPVPHLQLPDVSLFPRPERRSLRPDLVIRPRLLPEDRARIVAFLREGAFSVGPAFVPYFFMRPTTIDEVVDQARRLVLEIIPREDVAQVVDGVWLGLLVQAARLPPPLPPPFTFRLSDLDITPPAPAPARERPLQPSVGLQGTWHMSRRGPAEATVQVQLQDPDGTVQRVVQFALDLTTGDVQMLGGIQIQTPEIQIIRGVLSTTLFVQMLAGVTRVAASASGEFTVQVQAGASFTLRLGPVTSQVQIGPTVTVTGGDVSADLNVAGQAAPAQGFGLVWRF